MRRRKISLLLAFPVLCVLANCGGSDEDEVADVARNYLSATAQGDGEKACSHLSVDAKGVTADFAATELPELGTIECGEVLSALADFFSKEQVEAGLDAVDEMSADDVNINGDTATFSPAGLTVPFELEQDAGEWKITGDTIRNSFSVNYQP